MGKGATRKVQVCYADQMLTPSETWEYLGAVAKKNMPVYTTISGRFFSLRLKKATANKMKKVVPLTDAQKASR